MMPEKSHLLSLENVCKHYGKKRACDNIHLHLDSGRIHGLLGENGSGKSSLVKIIAGVIRKDSGRILQHGQVVDINSPVEARLLGIGTVFQHFSLFDSLSVEDNIALVLPPHISRTVLRQKTESIADKYGIAVDLDAYVDQLTVGERQRIEIVRFLICEPKILIMDEPTSVLTPQESDQLMQLVQRLADGGCGVLYISHRLEEVRELCDQVTILRHGSVVETLDPMKFSNRDLASKMMGEHFKQQRSASKHLDEDATIALSLENVTIDCRPNYSIALRGIDLALRQGEIFGVAGSAGHGQDLLSAVLSGEILCEGVKFSGQDVSSMDVAARKNLGFGYIPEDRHGHGALLNLNLIDNALLGTEEAGLWRNGWLSASNAKKLAEDIVDNYEVVCPGVEHQASTLSGGNLQKFVLGRVIKQQPKILLAVQPTWGLSVGSTRLIHELLISLAENGCAIILISQNLDELMKLSHRVGVLCEGQLSESLRPQETSLQDIGLLMSRTLSPAM